MGSEDKTAKYVLIAIPPNGEPFRPLVKYGSYSESTYEFSISAESLEQYQKYMPTYEKVVGIFCLPNHRSPHYEEAKSCKYELQRFLDKNWRQREAAKIDVGDYTALPPEWDDLTPIEDHYCHIADGGDEPDMVAFTESEAKGQRDVQTRMRAGKYVKRFYPHLTVDEVRHYASAVQSMNGVQMTDDPELAAEIYEHGPESCMAYGPDNWSWNTKGRRGKFDKMPRHPVAAYFAGDLQLAWLGSAEEATARALVWPEKKLYGRLYGAHDRLRTALERLGYRDCYNNRPYDHTCTFYGARFKIIRFNDTMVVMPYLDGISQLEYVYDTGEVHFGDSNTKAGKRTKVWRREGTESGLAHFPDPTIQVCAISGVRILPTDEVCRIDTTNEPVLRSELPKDYVLSVEGTWTRNPCRVYEDGEVRTHDINHRVSRDFIYCVDRIYYPTKDCFIFDNHAYIHKSNVTDDMIEYKGRYYSSLQQFSDYTGQKLPSTLGPYCPEEWELMVKEIASYELTSNENIAYTLHRRSYGRFVALVNHFEQKVRRKYKLQQETELNNVA